MAGAVPFNLLDEGALVGATVVAAADMLPSGVSVGGSTFIRANDTVTESIDTVGVSTAGKPGLWTLCILTAECADSVLDPSDESLGSVAPGVKRNPVCEVVRCMGW
jgi:hypothetical protein